MLINSIKNVGCCLLLLASLTVGCLQQPASDDFHDDQFYTMIQLVLNQYKRPFTLLDIDADQGYYSLRAAKDYNAVCVMIEARDQLLEICKAHDELTNIVLLKQRFTPALLQHLGECEHFDVVLALNGLDEFGEQWQAALEAMLGLGDYLIVKVSSKDKDLEQYVVAQGGQSIGRVPRSADEVITLYSIVSSNKYLRRKTWLRSIMNKPCLYRIESSFTHKQLVKPVSWPHAALKITPWIAGINLCTFKMCCGAYPTSAQLKDNLLSLKEMEHTDWLMNNMIVQGTTLALIDHDDPLSKRYFSETLLHAHQEMLDLNEPEKVEHYFWNKLIKVPVSARQIIKFFSQLFPVSSTIFEIGSSDNALIDRYLGYGAKVICYNPSADCVDELRLLSRSESLIVVDASQQEQAGSLENLVAQYGKPAFCIVHAPAEAACACIKTVSQPIGCIAYKFAVRDKVSLRACLDHLVLLGYSQFNFSARNLPILILDSNPYTNIHKEWASSADLLMHEIDEFEKLDYDGKNLWGYIFARYS